MVWRLDIAIHALTRAWVIGLLFILCTIVSMSSIMGLFLLFKQIMIETLTLQCTYLRLLKMNFS